MTMIEPSSHNTAGLTRLAHLTAVQKREKSLVLRRRLLVALFYVLAALWGVRLAFVVDRRIDLLFSVAMAICATLFCIADARVQGKPLLHSYYWLIVITWPVAVPLYLVFTREFRRIWRIALYILAWFVVQFLSYSIVYLIVSAPTV